MHHLDAHTAKVVVGSRSNETFWEELRAAKAQRRRGMRWARLTGQGGRALVQMGSQLIALGKRLEQRHAARSSA